MTDAVTAPAAAPAAPAPSSSATSALTSAPATAPVADPAAAPAETAPAAAPVAAAPTIESIPLPGKDAKPEEWEAVYTKLGRPATPEEYGLTAPDGADESFVKVVAPLLHKAGLTAAQAKVMNEGWNKMQVDAQAQLAAQAEAAAAAAESKNKAEEAALTQEWGAANTENMEFAKRAVTQFFPKENAGDIIGAIESKIGYAATIKLMHSIGKGLGEHDAAGLGANNAGGVAQKSIGERLYGGQT